MNEQIYTPTEVNKILRLGMNKVYDLLNSGKIRSIREGRKFLIPSSSINDYINSGLTDADNNNSYRAI